MENADDEKRKRKIWLLEGGGLIPGQGTKSESLKKSESPKGASGPVQG